MIEIGLFDKCNRQYIQEAAKLLADIFPHAFGDCAMEEIQECLEDDNIAMMAVSDGHIIGFAGANPHYDGNVWELHPIAVNKAHQF